MSMAADLQAANSPHFSRFQLFSQAAVQKMIAEKKGNFYRVFLTLIGF